MGGLGLGVGIGLNLYFWTVMLTQVHVLLGKITATRNEYYSNMLQNVQKYSSLPHSNVHIGHRGK